MVKGNNGNGKKGNGKKGNGKNSNGKNGNRKNGQRKIGQRKNEKVGKKGNMTLASESRETRNRSMVFGDGKIGNAKFGHGQRRSSPICNRLCLLCEINIIKQTR